MRVAALVLTAGMLIGAVGCSSVDYYRLPRPGTAEGSIANEVEYAFFSMVKPRFGLPYAYTEFNPDVDDQVVFYAGVQRRRPAIVLRGVLYRPDGVEQAAFTRTGSPWINETYDMALLRPHIGRWTLKLFLDDALVGTYPFVLADKARIDEFRRVR